MAEVAPTTRVKIWSSDSWSGKKLEETKHFDNKPEAEEFVRKFNAKNNKSQVPEYYEYAELD